MDKFLELSFMNYIRNDEEVPAKFDEIFQPFIDRLDSLLSNQLSDELQTMLVGIYADAMRIAGVAGMKLAIGVIDGSIKQVIG